MKALVRYTLDPQLTRKVYVKDTAGIETYISRHAVVMHRDDGSYWTNTQLDPSDVERLIRDRVLKKV